MPIIQGGDIGQRLAKRYGIKGRFVTPELEYSLQPVVLVDDLTDTTTLQKLDKREATGGDSIAVVTANTSWIGLHNPIGPKPEEQPLLVLHSIIATSDVSLDLQAGWYSNAGSSGIISPLNNQRGTPFIGPPNPQWAAGRVSQQTIAGGLAFLLNGVAMNFFVNHTSGPIWTQMAPMIIPVGLTFAVKNRVIGQGPGTLSVSFQWYELDSQGEYS